MTDDEVNITIKQCLDCPYHYIDDDDWVCCKLLDTCLDFWLDYAGKIPPYCPLRKKE